MTADNPSPPPPITPANPPPPPRKKSHWLLYGCGGLLVLALMVVVSVVITLWWLQRPIKPVVLSPPEKAAVDQKLKRLEDGNAPPASSRTAPRTSPAPAPVPNRAPELAELPPAVPGAVPDSDRRYTPGAKAITITEREINGLLNANTDLGQSVRIEFARDAVNAYLAVPIPKDFPVMGGKMFRARGRFRVSLGNGGQPYAVLEDVTVFGVSLPNAWLGGLKGQNLIGEALGEGKSSPVLRGIKSLRVEPGALVLELQD